MSTTNCCGSFALFAIGQYCNWHWNNGAAHEQQRFTQAKCRLINPETIFCRYCVLHGILGDACLAFNIWESTTIEQWPGQSSQPASQPAQSFIVLCRYIYIYNSGATDGKLSHAAMGWTSPSSTSSQFSPNKFITWPATWTIAVFVVVVVASSQDKNAPDHSYCFG